jgi:hypothetical protein
VEDLKRLGRDWWRGRGRRRGWGRGRGRVTSDGGTGAKRNLMEDGVQTTLETTGAGGQSCRRRGQLTGDGRRETGDGRGKGTRDRGTRRRCRRGCQIKRAAGMTQGGVRASLDDERERARHHRKQAASPARLKTDEPPSPACLCLCRCRCLAPRVNGASSPVCVPAKRREKSVLPQSLRAPSWAWAWDCRGLDMATSGSAARMIRPVEV